MKYGICPAHSPLELQTNLDHLTTLKSYGFDYLELPLASVNSLKQEECKNLITSLHKLGFQAEVCNVFLPAHLKLTGPNVDRDAIIAYLKQAIPKAYQLGTEIIVFGSGGARTVPDGFIDWKPQIRWFLQQAVEIAAQHSISIAIEPLRKAESNILNATSDCREFYDTGAKQLLDFYHLEEEKEPLSNILELADTLIHVHTADTKRLVPGSGTYPHTEYKHYLDKIHYFKRITIECVWTDYNVEAPKGLQFLRNIFS